MKREKQRISFHSNTHSKTLAAEGKWYCTANNNEIINYFTETFLCISGILIQMGNVRCEDLQSIIIEPPICYYPIHRHNRHIYYAQYNTALPHVEIYAKWYSLPHRKSIRKLLASLGVSCVCPRQHESIVVEDFWSYVPLCPHRRPRWCYRRHAPSCHEFWADRQRNNGHTR
jgi:hypothetical protein